MQLPPSVSRPLHPPFPAPPISMESGRGGKPQGEAARWPLRRGSVRHGDPRPMPHRAPPPRRVAGRHSAAQPPLRLGPQGPVALVSPGPPRPPRGPELPWCSRTHYAQTKVPHAPSAPRSRGPGASVLQRPVGPARRACKTRKGLTPRRLRPLPGSSARSTGRPDPHAHTHPHRQELHPARQRKPRRLLFTTRSRRPRRRRPGRRCGRPRRAPWFGGGDRKLCARSRAAAAPPGAPPENRGPCVGPRH